MAIVSNAAAGWMRVAAPVAVLVLLFMAQASRAQPSALPVIERVKASIVAVGTFQRTRQPQFRFLGTGFAVGDGTLVATNAHVLPATLEGGSDPESLVVLLPARDPAQRIVREASRVAQADEHDLAVLRIGAPALPPLALGDSDRVREGHEYLFTGFPIGGVLGLVPATHRAMVAAVTPIVLPQGNSSQLEARVIRQLKDGGTFDIFQLDAMAHPGSSGSPLFAPDKGEVIGVMNMVIARATREAALPQPTGIAYAIPVRHLRELLRRVQ